MATAQDLIKALISGEYDGKEVSYEDVNGSFLSNFNIKKEELWENFLSFLKDEKTQLSHMPIFESDFEYDSLFEFINNNADLSDNILSNLKTSFAAEGINLDAAGGLKGDSKNYFWNESMSRALARFYQNFDVNYQQYRKVEMDTQPADWVKTWNFYYVLSGDDFVKNSNMSWSASTDYYLPDDDLGYLSIRFIKEADAAYSFSDDRVWVLPFYNVDKKTYTDIRGADAIDSVLRNSNEMQFTRKQTGNWIRLIMPKYLRKVEVEDLNRNFWVISSVLGAICNFLFGDNGPLKDLLESILKELVQLWENVLYLWATLAAMTQKDAITKMHSEILPISNNEFQDYIKFDNFDRPTFDKENLLPRAKYIIDTYSDCNICILLQVRDNNYKHNYYSKEVYPGFIFYDRNKEESKFLPLYINSSRDLFEIDAAAALSADGARLGTLKENEMTYEYLSPATSAAYQTEPYYVLLRTVPTAFDVTYDSDNTKIVINSLSFEVYDVASQIYGDRTDNKVYTFTKPSTTWDWDSDEAIITKTSSSLSPLSSTHESFGIEKGFYMGELVSYYGPVGEVTWRVKTNTIRAVPFIFDDYMAIESSFKNGEADSSLTEDEAALITSAIANDEGILRISAQEEPMSSTIGDFTIYSLHHNKANEDEEESLDYYTLEVYNELEQPDDWDSTSYYTKDGSDYVKATRFISGTVYYKRAEQTEEGKVESVSRYEHGAILYNPATLQMVIYPKYEFMAELVDNWVDENGDTVSMQGNPSIDEYWEIYLVNNKSFTTDDWIVRCTEVVYAVEKDSWDGNESIEKYESGIKKFYNNSIVQRITTHLFYADGRYARRVYDRAHEYAERMSGAAQNILGNTWQVLYENKDLYEQFAANRETYNCIKEADKDFDTYLNTGTSSDESSIGEPTIVEGSEG